MKKIVSAMLALVCVLLCSIQVSAVAIRLETGNYMETATTIPSFGTDYSSVISVDYEQDWFKVVTLAQDAEYTVTLKNNTVGAFFGIDMFVVDQNLNTIQSITRVNTGRSQSAVALLEGGFDYYLVIFPDTSQRGTGIYEFSITPNLPTYYTVKYDANGGQVALAEQNVQKGDSVTLPTPTREGYTCKGWAVVQDSAYPNYLCGARYTPSENVTLYAIWQSDTQYYTVTFDANGGYLSGEATERVLAGSSIVLPSANRIGYKFLGWTVQSGTDPDIYPAGGSYAVYADTTMQAVWEKQTTFLEKIVQYLQKLMTDARLKTLVLQVIRLLKNIVVDILSMITKI